MLGKDKTVVNYFKTTALKIAVLLIIMFIAIFAVSFLWSYPLTATLILIGLAFIKHRIFPLKNEFVWFVISGFLGGVAESIAIYFGAWHYSQTNLFNIPIWLPMLWGLAGISGISIYLILTNNGKN